MPCFTVVQIPKKNNTIITKITQLQATYKIHNQFDIGLKATYAKLSRKWSKVTKCIGVQVSQLI